MKKRQVWILLVNMLLLVVCFIFLGVMFIPLGSIFTGAAANVDNSTTGLMIKVILAFPLPIMMLTLLMVLVMSASFFFNKQA